MSGSSRTTRRTSLRFTTKPDGFPNDVADTDDHTVTLCRGASSPTPRSVPLTNDQFRLLYRLEVAPNVYRLQASNPGQFYFNGF